MLFRVSLCVSQSSHFSLVQDALRAVHIKRRDLFEPCEELVRRGMGRAQREAYIMFTDLLVVFSRALRKHAKLAGLVLVPEPSLQETLQVSHGLE